MKPILFLLLAVASTANAQTHYKCVAPDGSRAYQDSPCAVRTAKNKEFYMEATPTPQKKEAIASDAASAPQGLAPFKKSPQSPTLRFMYDHSGAPVTIAKASIEAAIRESLDKWGQRCNVNLVYGGTTTNGPTGRQSIETGFLIRWDSVLQRPDGLGATSGLAGPTAGVILSSSQLRNVDDFRSTAAHEIGHVLGVPHIHEDKQSIMSYLRHNTPGPLSFSESDYLTCNIAIASQYGVPYVLPAGTKTAGMSDAEALTATRRGRY